MTDGVLSHASLRSDYRRRGYVAHALGEVGGVWYTNSKEAFLNSYKAGFRMFEADLIRLADGEVIAAHDGLEKHYGLSKRFEDCSWDEVHGLTYRGVQSSIMSAEDVGRLFAHHPDALLIADTKGFKGPEDHLLIMEKLSKTCPSAVLKRVIPHLRDHVELADMQAIYPWSDYMLALYRTQWRDRMPDQEALDFVRENQIGGVMMWYRNADQKLTLVENNRKHQRFSRQFALALQGLGAAVYVHDLERSNLIDQFKSMDVGVYSKGWIE